MKQLYTLFPYFNYYVVSIVVVLIMFYSFSTSSTNNKRKILYGLSFLNFIAYIINDYYFYIRGDKLLTLLPLQLCNIAVFLIPLALISKKTIFTDFLFYICVPGAFAALLIPSSDYIGKPYSLMTASFYMFHFLIVLVPLLMIRWEIYNPTPSIKKAIQMTVVLLSFSGIIHGLNVVLGIFFHVKANYFFTIIKYSAPNNFVFDLLSQWIPYNYFYLFPSIIVLFFYIGIIYFIQQFNKSLI